MTFLRLRYSGDTRIPPPAFDSFVNLYNVIFLMLIHVSLSYYYS